MMANDNDALDRKEALAVPTIAIFEGSFPCSVLFLCLCLLLVLSEVLTRYPAETSHIYVRALARALSNLHRLDAST